MSSPEIRAALIELQRTSSQARARHLTRILRIAAASTQMDVPTRKAVEEALAARHVTPPPPPSLQLQVGETWLLLHDRDASTGLVAKLQCVPLEAGETLPNVEFRSEIGRASRGMLATLGRACRTLIDHRQVSIRVGEPVLDQYEITGGSLGLAVVVASVSRQLGRSPLAEVVGTAQVTDSGELRPVAFLGEKLAALRSAWPGVRLVVVAKDQEVTDDDLGNLEVFRAGRLEDALPRFGLDHCQLPKASIEDHQTRLDGFAKDHAKPHGVADWQRLAFEAWETAEALASVGDHQSAGRALSHSARFSLHAGDSDTAIRTLSGIDFQSGNVPSELRAAKLIADATVAIDACKFDAAVKSASAAVASMTTDRTTKEQHLLYGQALGTHGRALLHGGDLAAAEPILRATIDHFERFIPYEAPRSRCALATCLRLSRQPQAALEEIDRALRETEGFPLYALSATTQFYLRLERGRILIALARWSEAIEDLLCVRRGQPDEHDYPRLGATRDLALAMQEVGKSTEARQMLRTCLDVARESVGTIGATAAIAAGRCLSGSTQSMGVDASELHEIWSKFFGNDLSPEALRNALESWVY